MKIALATSIVLLTSAAGLFSVEQDSPKFEVASFKLFRGERDNGRSQQQVSSHGVLMHQTSMGMCIRVAYGLTVQRPWELVGPAWLDYPTDFVYEVSAKTSRPEEPEQIRLMMQNLLKERVGLTSHWEMREMASYSLTRERKEPRLTPSKQGEKPDAKPGSTPDEYVFTSVSMEELALQLGPPMTARPVADMTQLSGRFDFTLNLTPYLADPETGVVNPASRRNLTEPIARALHEQLGLQLKPSRNTFRVLVVDHVDKTPKEN